MIPPALFLLPSSLAHNHNSNIIQYSNIQPQLISLEFHLQLAGMILTTCGLFFGGIALQYKSLLILYLLCALPYGFGGLAIYQRLVFIHQLWFKKIGKQNVGTYVLNFLSLIFA